MHDILIVDDQPYLQDLYAFELTDCNYTIVVAEDIGRARKYLVYFKFDLVILDLYIKGFHSWDLLDEIKNKYPTLPILIVTSYDSFMDDPRAMKADAYLVKNFQNISLITQKVNELLR